MQLTITASTISIEDIAIITAAFVGADATLGAQVTKPIALSAISVQDITVIAAACV